MAKKSNDKNVDKKNQKDKKPKFTTRVKRFFQGLSAEIKKVVWPGKKEVKETAGVVVLVAVLVMVLIFVVDKLMLGILNLMGFNTARPQPSESQTQITSTQVESSNTTSTTTEMAETTTTTNP